MGMVLRVASALQYYQFRDVDPSDVELTLTVLTSYNLAKEVVVTGDGQQRAAGQREKANVKTPLRILLLEDDAHDAELIQEFLEADQFVCEITRTQTRAEFVAALEGVDIDVILAAQALSFGPAPSDIVVATSNAKHLSQFITAQNWNEIVP